MRRLLKGENRSWRMNVHLAREQGKEKRNCQISLDTEAKAESNRRFWSSAMQVYSFSAFELVMRAKRGNGIVWVIVDFYLPLCSSGY